MREYSGSPARAIDMGCRGRRMRARHLYAYRYLRNRKKIPVDDGTLYQISARGRMLLAPRPGGAGNSLPDTLQMVGRNASGSTCMDFIQLRDGPDKKPHGT